MTVETDGEMSEAGRRDDSAPQEIQAGLAWLHAADPVLARLIDGRPGFDPDVWVRRLPAMGLFGPAPAEVADLAQGWRPCRSIASSLLLATAKPR